MRNILEAYELTWDTRLRELIYELTDRHLYDPESPVLLTKARPHRSSTYKMETDGDVLLMLYQIFGDRLFYNMTMAIAEYNWDKAAINPPLFGQNRSTGFLGYFLWEETGDPKVISNFDYGRRRMVAARFADTETGAVKLPCVSQIPRFFKGLPLAMDILVRTGAMNSTPASWLAFHGIESFPARIFFIKPGETVYKGHYAPLEKVETSMEVMLRNEGSASVEHFKGRVEDGVVKPAASVASTILKPYTVLRYPWAGHDLHSVTEESSGVVKVDIPADAPGGVYELEVNKEGAYSVFTDKNTPLALYAPGGWTPFSMCPPVKIYFNVPEGTVNGRIFFEKEVRLFTPDGGAFNGGENFSGWVKLPADKFGLWSFESIEPGKVKTENLPGFFSMGSPDFYMEHK